VGGRSSLQVLHWNCRGALSSLPDIQYLANNYQIICIQESLLLPSSNFNVLGFHCLRSDVSRPGTRGLCILIRKDFRFSLLNLSNLSHPSTETLAVLIHCSLESPLLIINFYRHPNSKTPSSFFSYLFSAISSYKYSLIVGDFNAHHHAWGDPRTDGQGDAILRACDAHNLIIMNDGAPTFLSSSGNSTSTIDLSIFSRDLSLLSLTNTFSDLHGSDHYPISISISKITSSSLRYIHRLNLSAPQLSTLYCRLLNDTPKFLSLTSFTSQHPLRKYDLFCSFLLETISLLLPSGTLPPKKKLVSIHSSPSPWWNSTCKEAVEQRSTLLRIYKAHPSWDNWLAYKQGNTHCKKILRKEKRRGWRQLCSSFSSKTPTAAIWKFIRSYKNKSLSAENPPLDHTSKIESQNALLSKLCPPSCLHLFFSPLEELKISDSPTSPFAWLDDPFTKVELEVSIDSSKNRSSPGLDRIDYAIIRALPPDLRLVLLDILNELYCQGHFPNSWRASALILIPKSDNKGVRPIALLSCLLKVLERMIYRRLQWAVETHFLLPEFQSGFRNSRSCIDNLVTLTNRIHTGFLRKESTIAIFLDIAGAFDNVIPNILIQELRNLGLPACFCKFIENLLLERSIYVAQNGNLDGPWISHKGTPQGSILSPLLFNIYLKNVGRHIHKDSHILQYADDIVLFASNKDISLARDSLALSLESIFLFLASLGLSLSPSKSQSIIFSRKRKIEDPFAPFTINDTQIPIVEQVRFLGVILDRKLNGTDYLKSLIAKGFRVANIVTSLSGVWWGAHPSLLLSIYRSVYRGAIEYGAQVFNLSKNHSLFLKLQRQQFRIIRSALGLRQSTPISVLLSESCEPPLELRFALLTSRFIYKSFARNSSLVLRSLRRLEIESRHSSSKRRIQLIKDVPSLKPFILQKYALQSIHRSVTPPLFSYNYPALLPTPQYASFDISSSSRNKKNSHNNVSVSEVRNRFREFSSPLINDGISVYSDGSKKDADSAVGAAVYSPELGLAIKHKLPSDVTVFSAEAWAIYQALILVDSSSNPSAAIFSDSRSVLDALSSPIPRSGSNYLIPMIRDKFHSLTASGISICFAWVPSHRGIPGNERVDSLAKQAASNGRKPKFKIPFTDFFPRAQQQMKTKLVTFLQNDFLVKGTFYYSHFFHPTLSKPWFFRLPIPREQIVTLGRLRSNHYNLNYSLHRKNIVASSACPCGDPHQDANHTVFRCPLTRSKSHNLLSYLYRNNPQNYSNLFPSLKDPSPKLCRLLTSFFKANNLLI